MYHYYCNHLSTIILLTFITINSINGFSFHSSYSNNIPFLKSHFHNNKIKDNGYHNRKNSLTTSGSRNFELRMSSIGDGGGSGGNGNSNKRNKGDLDDWLDPRKSSSESENLKRAREKISEESLPISFAMNDNDNDNDGNKDSAKSMQQDDNKKEEDDDDDESVVETVRNLMNNENDDRLDETQINGKLELLRSNSTATNQLMTSNPYLQVVAKLSPSELISKFTSTAHPRVQDAVRSTVLGLIGTLPKMAFETTTITTGERLASLMFQLQLTGYMLKNADYRLSLSQSLGVSSNSINTFNGQNQFLLEGDLDDEDEEGTLSEGKVRGTIKITYGNKSDSTNRSEKENDEEDSSTTSSASIPSMEVEVDAAAYMAELRNEVAKLREDLITTRKAKEDEIRKDLLLYIRTLPQKELKSLTGTLSDDVLNAMKGLVNVVMAGIGEGQIGPDTVTEQSGEAMAQLCMWQLVVGYNLRELEVREEMKNALRSGSLDFGSNQSNTNSDRKNDEGSIDFEKGGFE